MADYVEITDTQLDPDAPLTSQLAYQWRDNPIAIAQGADGAPRIARKIFGMDLDVSYTGITGYTGCRVTFKLNAEPTATCSVQFSSDGTTWPASRTLVTGASPDGSVVVGDYYFNFADGSYISIQEDGEGVSTGTISGMPAAPTHIRFLTVSTVSGGGVCYPDGGVALS